MQRMWQSSVNQFDITVHKFMMEEILYEVQQQFPKDKIPTSILTTIYYTAKLDHAKQLVAALNNIPNQELVSYLINLLISDFRGTMSFKVNRSEWYRTAWPDPKFWKGGNRAMPKPPAVIMDVTKYDEHDGQTLTPLIIGAMHGNANLVKTILLNYKVDLELEGNVIFDGLIVYGATPLWVAAGMGHLNIVKMLIHSGANVNHNTQAQSSPLRAACYEGRLDIVKYLIDHGADVNLSNIYRNTSIMIAAYKGHVHVVDALLKSGANPNEQALCGATALHYAAECGHLEVCRLLLDHNARLLYNEHGLTPVMQAAERTHEEVVEMFLNRSAIMSKEDKIRAIELMGASFANDKDNYNVSKSFQYMMRAMEMRFSDTHKVIRKRLIEPIRAYDNWAETETIQDLQAIRLNHHSIHMEALTVRERVLGKTYPDLAQPIVYRGAIFADQGRFEMCQILWSYAIDLRMNINLSVERDLLRFAQLFSQILRSEGRSLDISVVISVMEKCHKEIEKNKRKIANPGPKDVPEMIIEQNDQNVVTALYLIKIVTKILHQKPQLQKQQIEQLYSAIFHFIQCDTRLRDGQTLLHLAVNGVTPVDDFYTSDVCRFPCFRTALVLVHVGAALSAVDYERNTPLHTLVLSIKNPRENLLIVREAEKIVKLFVEAGSHLDAVNSMGLTPARMSILSSITCLITSYQIAQSSLKCTAARSIARHRLNYKGLVPKALETFIQMHSAEKYCL